MLDFGVTILKTSFGAATVSDINLLRDVINYLQLKCLDISHSLSSQLTYVKDLSAIININSEAITNLSGVIKVNVVQIHEEFQQVTRGTLWLNITRHQQNTLYSTIMQMEITLAQMTQR